jgi:hypothetical protein
MAGEKTKAEIEKEQKLKWLDEHLPYELMMARYTIKRLKERIFWLDWNAYNSGFAVAAANLSGFLTNGDTGNLKASDFVEGFKSRKGDLASTFAKMEPQIFHLGKGRPSDKGKFDIKDATDAYDWIEAEMAKFIVQLGDWSFYWNQERSVPEERPKEEEKLLNVLGPQSASSATPLVFGSIFTGTGPDAASMARMEKEGRAKPVGPEPKK